MPKKPINKKTDETGSQKDDSQQLEPEQQLLLQIEKMRRQQQNTLELYVEVARLLFFEEEIIPTTNRMYQLVRRGSMGTPAQALRIFWSQLRDESQVRMQKAPLPSTVVRQAEQLLAQLWDEAVSHSTEHLHKDRLHLQAQAQHWHEQLQGLRDANQQLTNECSQLLENLSTKQRAIEDGLQQQADLSAQLQQKQLEAAQVVSRHDEKEKQWNSEREQLIAQLEQANQEIIRTEERAQAHEKRALLEIERARQEAKATANELTQEKQQLQLQLKEIKVIHELQEAQLKQAKQSQEDLQKELLAQQELLLRTQHINETLKTELNQLQQEHTSSLSQLTQAENQQQKLRRQVNRLERRLQRRRQRSTRGQSKK